MSKVISTDKKSGFNRLKGLAAAAVMGAGFGGAPLTLRASTSGYSQNLNIVYGSSVAGTESAYWIVGAENSSIPTSTWTSYIYTYTTWMSFSTSTPVYGSTCTPSSSSFNQPSCQSTTTTWIPIFTSYPVTRTTTFSSPTSSSSSYYNYQGTTQNYSYGSTVTGFGLKNVSYWNNGEPSASGGNLFDGLGFSVNENNFIPPYGSVDLNTNVITTGTRENIVPNVDANLEYFFSEDLPFVRALYTLTNTSSSSVDVELSVFGELNYEDATEVLASSDNNLSLNNGDEWVVFGREEYLLEVRREGNSPVIAFGRFGGIAPLVKPTNEGMIAYGDYTQAYDLSIPANSSRSVMVYMALAANLNAAKSTIAELSENPEVLLEGLSEQDIAGIVNYDFSEGEGTEADIKKKKESFFGSFDLAFLLAASGALAIRKKKIAK